jgi:uncharacterized protein YggE
MKTGRFLTIVGAAVVVALVAVALAVAWVAPRNAGTASAQTNTDATHPSQITVRGSGTVDAKPDTLKMDVGVTLQSDTAKDAQQKVSGVMDKIVAALKAAGIDEKDYRTSQYSVDPVMDYGGAKGGTEPPKLTGFQVTNMLQVTLHQPERAADLLDSLVSAGANNIYNLYYTFADEGSLSQQAYNQAVQDAQTKATKLAGLSNMQLGKVLSVTEASANIPGPLYDGMTGGKGAGAGIVPGQQSVQVDLIVTYEATPGK